jgi:nitroreductase
MNKPPPRKPAPTQLPIVDLIKERWSPLAFSPEPIEQEKIQIIFEAARWAPSSFNEQPWRYIYALKGDEGRETLESLLVPGNGWAKNAGMLMIDFASTIFAKNGKVNRHALHDLGAANGFITLQARSLGLMTHQMAGFDFEHANEILGVPKEFIPGSMMAIGYYGDPSQLDEKQRAREETPRVRRPIQEFAFRGRWGATIEAQGSERAPTAA